MEAGKLADKMHVNEWLACRVLAQLSFIYCFIMVLQLQNGTKVKYALEFGGMYDEILIS